MLSFLNVIDLLDHIKNLCTQVSAFPPPIANWMTRITNSLNFIWLWSCISCGTIGISLASITSMRWCIILLVAVS